MQKGKPSIWQLALSPKRKPTRLNINIKCHLPNLIYQKNLSKV